MARGRGQTNQDVEFRFFTVPVAFALAFGALIATIISPYLPVPFFMLSLFGVSFTTAHMLSHSWRRRGLRNKRQSAEEEERERRALAARAAREAGEEPRRRRTKPRRRA